MMKFMMTLGGIGAVIAFFVVGSWYDDTYGFEGSTGAAFGAAVAVFVGFLIIGCIINAVISGKEVSGNTYISERSERICEVYDFEKSFVNILENTVTFQQAYVAEVQDWIHIYITVKCEKTYWSSTIYDDIANIEFSIQMGNWWDKALGPSYSSVEDYMMNIFTYNLEERTFTYVLENAGKCKNGAFTKKQRLVSKIHEYIRNFESNNPYVQFKLKDWGASWSSMD